MEIRIFPRGNYAVVESAKYSATTPQLVCLSAVSISSTHLLSSLPSVFLKADLWLFLSLKL